MDTEAVVQRCSVKNMFIEISQNSQENTCEFCEIFKNNFSYRTPPVAAFVDSQCFLFLPQQKNYQSFWKSLVGKFL